MKAIEAEAVHTTCSKLYQDIPFAHRQWKHKGHCNLIHGHNWSFKFTFAAHQLDDNGFVVDFGSLTELKNRLKLSFDHALVLCQDDPRLREIDRLGIAQLMVLPDASAEGLARYLLHLANTLLLPNTRDVRCVEVTVWEDQRNSATFTRPWLNKTKMQ